MHRRPPLDGIRVLELSTGIAAQTAGMLLADLGADVVRPIDAVPAPPDDLPGYLCWNRGKQLVQHKRGKVERALEIRRLAERADILIADPQPGRLEAQGLDAAALAATAPTLVHVFMPPIAAGGRWAELPHDALLLDAVSGFAAHHPASEERPVASVVPLCLHLQGAMAAGAAVAGLVARTRDGWGRAATVTGLQAAGAALCTLVTRSIDGPPTISVGKTLRGSPQFRLYQGSDRRWMFLAALSPELFIRALDVLDRMDVMAREDVAGDFVNLQRPDIVGPVGAELEAVFATRTTDEWLAGFTQAGVPAAALAPPEEWLLSEVVASACPPARSLHRDLGAVILPGVPVDLSRTPGRVGAPPDGAATGAVDEIWRDTPRPAAPKGERPPSESLPLAGLRVVDLSTFLAAPFVGSLLATHGAEVVKLESPSGDPYSLFTASYAIVNEHKRALTLDLRATSDREAFLDLLGRADVCIDNLLPSSLERLGLGASVFEQASPELVRCSVTAFGQLGAWSDLPGFDPLLQTMTGLASIQGGDGDPVATAAPVHDVTAGSVGALGTLAALYVRETRGFSQRVFTSLAAASTLLQSGELTSYAGRPNRAIGGVDFPGPDACRRYYRGQDRWIAVAATTPAQRSALLRLLGCAELEGADEAARSLGLADAFRERTVEEWVTALAALGVPACQVLERVELDDPFLRDQCYSHVVDSAAVGRLDLIGGFADWRGAPRRPPTPPHEFQIDIAEARQRFSRAHDSGSRIPKHPG